MLRALIIDDEEQSRNTLANYLARYCHEVELAGEATGVVDGLVKIHYLKPELVFLDIEMPDGSGFDLLEKLEEVNFGIIFVTAFDHYALKAFRFSALDYLLKPVDPEMLVEAVTRATEIQQTQFLPKQLQLVRENKNGFEKIAVPVFEGMLFITIREIVRCQAERNYSVFHMRNGEKVMVSKTLKEYDELLTPLRFYRVHHSHLINLACVKKFIRTEGGSVLMDDGFEVGIARRRKEGFLEALFS